MGHDRREQAAGDSALPGEDETHHDRRQHQRDVAGAGSHQRVHACRHQHRVGPGDGLVQHAAEVHLLGGVLYQTVARTNPVLVTTTVYALVTAGTRNAALVLAAVVMGFIFARQRRVAGGLLAPVVTHLAWSLLMVLLLPR